MNSRRYVENHLKIFEAAKASDDGTRCAVSASPEAREQLKAAIEELRASGSLPTAFSLKAPEPTALGLNDGVIVPPDSYPLGTSPSVIRAGAADRAPLRGVLRVIIVLVDFTDKHMVQTKQHFQDLFFKQGGAQKSVREYYAEVTNGMIEDRKSVV